jgi:hypothetical protein
MVAGPKCMVRMEFFALSDEELLVRPIPDMVGHSTVLVTLLGGSEKERGR